MTSPLLPCSLLSARRAIAVFTLAAAAAACSGDESSGAASGGSRNATGGSSGGSGGSHQGSGGSSGASGTGGLSGGSGGSGAGVSGSSGSSGNAGTSGSSGGSGSGGNTDGGPNTAPDAGANDASAQSDAPVRDAQVVPPSDRDQSGGPVADRATRMKCTGANPVHCHFEAAVGNYDISFVLGGAAAGKTSVDSECHRKLLPEISTAAGESKRYAFTVNVRQPEGEPVRPAQEKKDAGDPAYGTDGLDLYFSGTPQLDAFGYAAAVKPTVVYIAGDSTVTDQFQFPEYSGWGQMLAQYFQLGVSVANYADSGESSQSFISDKGLFPAIMKVIKANDYLLIQLGHNDRTISEADYRKNMTRMVTDAKSKGAFPILVTPIARAQFSGGKVTQQHLHQDDAGNTVDLPAIIRSLAKSENVPLIDLTALTSAWLEQVGEDPTTGWKAYHAIDAGKNDATHTNAAGAQVNAKFVRDALKDLNIKPLVDFIR